MAVGELPRVAGVDDDRSMRPEFGELGRRERARRRGAVVAGAFPAVEVGVVGEVARGGGQSGGDQGHEGLPAHRHTGVVGGALLADRGLLLGREVLAAGRSGAVGGKDPDRVGEGHQFVLDTVVEHRAEFLGRHTGGGEEVGAADVADEQRVAGQHSVGDLVVAVLVHEDADRLGGVAGGLHDLQGHLAEGDALALGEGADRVLGLGAAAVADPCSGPVGQLQVSGDEVRVEVGVDHPDDGEAPCLGVRQVLRDVPSRVDDDRPAGRLVGDQVRRLGEAVEVVLREEHGEPSV